jgi:large subunit ribosomal protein L25
MKVPLHFINQEIAPGVKTGGGTVNHVITELDIVCLPDDLPEYVEVNLAELQLGHSIHLSEVELPKGVEAAHRRGGDDPVVVTITVPRVEAEPEAAEAAAAEPAAAAAPAGPAAEGKGDKK